MWCPSERFVPLFTLLFSTLTSVQSNSVYTRRNHHHRKGEKPIHTNVLNSRYSEEPSFQSGNSGEDDGSIFKGTEIPDLYDSREDHKSDKGYGSSSSNFDSKESPSSHISKSGWLAYGAQPRRSPSRHFKASRDPFYKPSRTTRLSHNIQAADYVGENVFPHRLTTSMEYSDLGRQWRKMENEENRRPFGALRRRIKFHEREVSDRSGRYSQSENIENEFEDEKLADIPKVKDEIVMDEKHQMDELINGDSRIETHKHKQRRIRHQNHMKNSQHIHHHHHQQQQQQQSQHQQHQLLQLNQQYQLLPQQKRLKQHRPRRIAIGNEGENFEIGYDDFQEHSLQKDTIGNSDKIKEEALHKDKMGNYDKLRGDTMQKDEMQKDTIENYDKLRDDTMQKVSMQKDTARNHYTLKEDAMQKVSMQKDTARNYYTLKGDMMQKDLIQKDAMQKDTIQKEDMLKDMTVKHGIPNDAATAYYDDVLYSSLQNGDTKDEEMQRDVYIRPRILGDGERPDVMSPDPALRENLKFRAIPSSVVVGETGTLVIECEVRTQALSNSEVGQPMSLEIMKASGQSSRRLAVLSRLHGAIPIRDDLTENATINGSVDKVKGEPWTLSITWSPPGRSLGGTYLCQLTTVGDKFAPSEQVYTKLDVSVTESTKFEFQDRIESLEDKIDSMMKTEQNLSSAQRDIQVALMNVTSLIVDTQYNNKLLKDKLNAQALAYHGLDQRVHTLETSQLRMSLHMNTTQESLAATMELQAEAMDVLRKQGRSFVSGLHALETSVLTVHDELRALGDTVTSDHSKRSDQFKRVERWQQEVEGNRTKLLNDLKDMKNTLHRLTGRFNGTSQRLRNLQAALGLEDGAVRLINYGEPGKSGRLEVFLNGQWGTVCDDHFDVKAARVVCLQLGHGTSSAKFVSGAKFGSASGLPIHIGGVICYGQEKRILECSHSALGVEHCTHAEDVGVSCV